MYDYEREKTALFTDEGQRMFLQIRDNANQLLEDAGAFAMCRAWKGVTGDTWKMTACVDRMVELGELREITPKGVAWQDRVFVKGRTR